MTVTVIPLGAVRAEGGAVFLAQGAPACGVEWTLGGPGTLTALAPRSAPSGSAAARYDAAGVAAGSTITVTARFYA